MLLLLLNQPYLPLLKLDLLLQLDLLLSLPLPIRLHLQLLPPPPSITSFISGGGFDIPFYQWWSNLGYCGEVSLIQSALSYGQWISQYNARCLNTSFDALVAQTAAEGKKTAENFAQILLDDSPEEGENVLSAAAGNFGLVATNFDSKNQERGQQGHQAFMHWIKAEISNGNRLTIGVVNDNSGRESYSHIVSVIRFDTDTPNSSNYNPKDVLYIDDHGMMTSGDNPAVPLGASSSSSTGKGAVETTFVFGYKLSEWSSKVTGSKPFAIPLPTNYNKNYGTSISGIKDLKGETFPVSFSFTTSNPSHPICGHRYEAPSIGTSDSGSFHRHFR